MDHRWIVLKTEFMMDFLSLFAASDFPFPTRNLNCTLRNKSQAVGNIKNQYHRLTFNHQDVLLMIFYPSAGLEECTNIGRMIIANSIFFPLLLLLFINDSVISPLDSEITSMTSRISNLLFKGKSTY